MSNTKNSITEKKFFNLKIIFKLVSSTRSCCRPRNHKSPVGTVFNPLTQKCCSSKKNGHFIIVKYADEGEQDCCNGKTYLISSQGFYIFIYNLNLCFKFL